MAGIHGAGYAGARDTRGRRIRTLKLLGGIREVVSLHQTHLHVHLVEVDVLVSFLGAGMLVDVKRRLRPVEELDLVGGLVCAGLAGDRAEVPAYRRETCGGVPWGCYVPCCVMGVGGLCDEEGQRRVLIMQIRRAAPLSQSYQSSGEDVTGIMSGYWRRIASGTDVTPPRAHAVQCAVHGGRNRGGGTRSPEEPFNLLRQELILHQHLRDEDLLVGEVHLGGE